MDYAEKLAKYHVRIAAEIDRLRRATGGTMTVEQMRGAAEAIIGPPPKAGGDRGDVRHDDIEPVTSVDNFTLTDSGNADRMVAKFGDAMRYCSVLKVWLRWDGRRWVRDKSNQSRALVEEMLRQLLQDGARLRNPEVMKFAMKSLSSSGILSALRMAEHRIPIDVDVLDADPYLLNFMNGTVNLKTGELQQHTRADLITRLIPYNYVPSAACPEFMAFLNRVTDGAKHMVDFLQRAFGYSLTGLSSEKCMFVAFGEGNTGKTTMLATLRQLASEYSTGIMATSLIGRRDSNTIQSDIADLNGTRFAISSEPPAGAMFSTGTVKRLCQGLGHLKARRLKENPQVFKETFSLWIDCNQLPDLDDPADEAAVGRLNPIQFKSPNDGINDDFPRKLLAEAEGILAWCVAGAVLGQAAVERGESRLQLPPEIDECRDHWRKDAWLTRFVREALTVDPKLSITPTRALELLKDWWPKSRIEENKMPTMTAFGIAMKKRFAWRKKDSSNLYYGVGEPRPRSETNPPDPPVV